MAESSDLTPFEAMAKAVAELLGPVTSVDNRDGTFTHHFGCPYSELREDRKPGTRRDVGPWPLDP
jgi:hypothetical protein